MGPLTDYLALKEHFQYKSAQTGRQRADAEISIRFRRPQNLRHALKAIPEAGSGSAYQQGEQDLFRHNVNLAFDRQR